MSVGWLKLRHYLCIGWGFPVVIVTMWASLIYATADKGANVVGEVAIQVANATANAVRRGKEIDDRVGLILITQRSLRRFYLRRSQQVCWSQVFFLLRYIFWLFITFFLTNELGKALIAKITVPKSGRTVYYQVQSPILIAVAGLLGPDLVSNEIDLLLQSSAIEHTLGCVNSPRD